MAAFEDAYTVLMKRQEEVLKDLADALGAFGYGGEPLGFSTVTGLSSAKGLHQGDLGAIPDGSEKVWVQAEGQDVRWRDDGTNPTSAIGHLLQAGSILEYDRAGLAALRFIETAVGATITVSFYS